MAREPSSVLGGDRSRPESRRGQRGGGRIIPRRLPVVPPRWWRETLPSRRWLAATCRSPNVRTLPSGTPKSSASARSP